MNGLSNRRERRTAREEAVLFMAVGAMMATGEQRLDSHDCVSERFRELLTMCADKSKEASKIDLWVRSHAGIERSKGESMYDAIIRTAKENARRKHVGDTLRKLSQQSENYTKPDADYLSEVDELVQQLAAKG